MNALTLALGKTLTLATTTGGKGPSVTIPQFKGEPGENVVAWYLQLTTIFAAQGVTHEPTMVHYAVTGLRDSALHWYLQKTVANGGTPPYNAWVPFQEALK